MDVTKWQNDEICKNPTKWSSCAQSDLTAGDIKNWMEEKRERWREGDSSSAITHKYASITSEYYIQDSYYFSLLFFANNCYKHLEHDLIVIPLVRSLRCVSCIFSKLTSIICIWSALHSLHHRRRVYVNVRNEMWPGGTMWHGAARMAPRSCETQKQCIIRASGALARWIRV